MIAVSQDVFSALGAGLWMAVIFIAVGFGLLAVRAVRRRLLNSHASEEHVLILDDLRKQRDEGLVTATEYEAVRRQVVAKIVTRRASTADAPADKLVQSRRGS